MLSTRGLVAVLALLYGCGGAVTADDVLLDDISARLHSWDAGSSFICRFELFQAEIDIDSMDDDLSNVTLSRCRNLRRVGKGLLAKSIGWGPQAAYRYEVENTVSKGKDDSSIFFDPMPVKELHGPTIGITYLSPDDNDDNGIVFLDRFDDVFQLERRDFEVWGVVSPLDPLGEGGLEMELGSVLAGSSQVEEFGGIYALKASRFRSWSEPIGWRTRLEMKLSYDKDLMSVGRYTFVLDVDNAYPITGERQSYNPPSREVFVLRDFVACANSTMPKTIILVNFEDSQTTGKCQIWKSEDLGDRQPTKDDFVLVIPANTEYVRFTRPIDGTKEQKIFLADLLGDDWPSEWTSDATIITAWPGGQVLVTSIRVIVLVVIVTLVAVICASVVMRQMRRKRIH